MIIFASFILIALSVLAFWKPIAPMFMIIAGISLMVGLEWYNLYTNETGMAISLGLIGYSFLCIGYTFKVIFWQSGEE